MIKDPYLYDDVPILKNKLNIKDKPTLEQAEFNITAAKLVTVDQLLGNKEITYNHLKNIHKHIFEDIFEWAGDSRTIHIYKPELVLGGDSIKYSYPSEIEKDANLVIDKLNNIKWDNLKTEEKIESYSKHIAELWQVHPFREGNTRTTIIFACHFASLKGFSLDRQVFFDHLKHLRNSLVMASDGMYAKHGYIQTIFSDAIKKGEEYQCIREIKSAGYKPTDNLVLGMKKVNYHFNKRHTVKDVLDMYRNIKALDKEGAYKVEMLSNEFRSQEIKEKKFSLGYENDI